MKKDAKAITQVLEAITTDVDIQYAKLQMLDFINNYESHYTKLGDDLFMKLKRIVKDVKTARDIESVSDDIVSFIKFDILQLDDRVGYIEQELKKL